MGLNKIAAMGSARYDSPCGRRFTRYGRFVGVDPAASRGGPPPWRGEGPMFLF